MDGGVSLPDNALGQSRRRSFTNLGFKALGCVWIDAVSGAVHLPQQPVGVFVHARAFLHVLEVVTASLHTASPEDIKDLAPGSAWKTLLGMSTSSSKVVNVDRM